jgi:hypothetical protein
MASVRLINNIPDLILEFGDTIENIAFNSAQTMRDHLRGDLRANLTSGPDLRRSTIDYKRTQPLAAGPDTKLIESGQMQRAVEIRPFGGRLDIGFFSTGRRRRNTGRRRREPENRELANLHEFGYVHFRRPVPFRGPQHLFPRPFILPTFIRRVQGIITDIVNGLTAFLGRFII